MLTEPTLSLVIPSRNEAANIPQLFQRLDCALAGVSREYILIDDSDDGTAIVASGLATTAELRVIHRCPGQRFGGLGGALRLGFEAARGKWVCVLDSDLQHPPEKVPALVAAGERTNAELVIASRYVMGGTNIGLGAFGRRFVSRASTLASRILLFPLLEGIADSGSGFYLVRRTSIPLARYHPSGFKSLMELLVRGNWDCVVEEPYEFGVRHHGSTKAGFREGLNFVRHVLRLFLSEPRAGRIWKFLAVGATGVAVNLGALAALLNIGASPLVAWCIGVEASIISNFLLHLFITFPDRRLNPAKSCLVYHGSVAVGIAANAAVFFAATVTGVLEPLHAAGVGIAVAFATNYLVSDRLAFRDAPRRGKWNAEGQGSAARPETDGASVSDGSSR